MADFQSRTASQKPQQKSAALLKDSSAFSFSRQPAGNFATVSISHEEPRQRYGYSSVALEEIRRFADQIARHLQTSRDRRNEQQKLNDDQWAVSWASEGAATVSRAVRLEGVHRTVLPGEELWDKTELALQAVFSELQTGNSLRAAEELKTLAQEYAYAQEILGAYLTDVVNGAELTTTGLKITAAAGAIAATIASGGLAAGGAAPTLLGIAGGGAGMGLFGTSVAVGTTAGIYGATQEVAGQTSAKYIAGIQQEINWAVVLKRGAADAITGFVGALAGGFLAKQFAKLFGSYISNLSKEALEEFGQALGMKGALPRDFFLTGGQRFIADFMSGIGTTPLTAAIAMAINRIGATDDGPSAEEFLTTVFEEMIQGGVMQVFLGFLHGRSAVGGNAKYNEPLPKPNEVTGRTAQARALSGVQNGTNPANSQGTKSQVPIKGKTINELSFERGMSKPPVSDKPSKAPLQGKTTEELSYELGMSKSPLLDAPPKVSTGTVPAAIPPASVIDAMAPPKVSVAEARPQLEIPSPIEPTAPVATDPGISMSGKNSKPPSPETTAGSVVTFEFTPEAHADSTLPGTREGADSTTPAQEYRDVATMSEGSVPEFDTSRPILGAPEEHLDVTPMLEGNVSPFDTSRPMLTDPAQPVDIGLAPSGRRLKPYKGKKELPKLGKPYERTFGEPSEFSSGTNKRIGMNFGERNAAETMHGLETDYNVTAGRPNKVKYRVDAETSKRTTQTDRSFTKQESTEGAQPSDDNFTGTGYDRGHLAQREAFKGNADAERAVDQMPNIVPMHPNLNRGEGSPWRAAEAETIRLADKYGSVTVEIAPIYDSNPLRLPNGTPIPKGIHRKVIAPDGKILLDITYLNK